MDEARRCMMDSLESARLAMQQRRADDVWMHMSVARMYEVAMDSFRPAKLEPTLQALNLHAAVGNAASDLFDGVLSSTVKGRLMSNKTRELEEHVGEAIVCVTKRATGEFHVDVMRAARSIPCYLSYATGPAYVHDDTVLAHCEAVQRWLRDVAEALSSAYDLPPIAVPVNAFTFKRT